MERRGRFGERRRGKRDASVRPSNSSAQRSRTRLRTRQDGFHRWTRRPIPNANVHKGRARCSDAEDSCGAHSKFAEGRRATYFRLPDEDRAYGMGRMGWVLNPGAVESGGASERSYLEMTRTSSNYSRSMHSVQSSHRPKCLIRIQCKP